MPATLLPNAETQFFDNNGKPLAGGSVYFYIPNTTTFKATWQDSAQTVLNTNPVILDGGGRAIVWGSGIYRQQVYDVHGNLIWDQITEDTSAGLFGNINDNVYIAGTGFTPGVTTSLTISTAPGSPANMWVFFDGVFQTDDTYTLSGTTVTFNAAIPSGVQEVRIKVGSTIAIGVPGTGTITNDSVANNAAISSAKLAFLANGAGAVSRTVQSKLSDWISVKDYGAKGDGVTDDTVAIKAAIAYAGAIGGGTVYFPASTYLVSSPIPLTLPNVRLMGSSAYSATVTVPNNATGFIGYNPNAVFILNANHCGISNLGMNGNIANNSAQSFGAISTTVAVSGIFVTDCYIHDFIYNGIVTQPATGAVTNFRIERNTLQNIGWVAIGAWCSQIGSIADNQITSCGSNGILTGYASQVSNFTVSQYVTITGNYVTKATPPTFIIGSAAENGFMIVVGAGDQYITVSDNVCNDNRHAAQDGIGLGQDGTRINEGLVFDSNVVIYAGLYGIDVASNHVVSNNYIRYSAQQGIKLGTDQGGNLTNAIVIGNIIDSCNFQGTGSNQGIWVAATLNVAHPTALYQNIEINDNLVIDFNAPAHTVYGLGIAFQNNLTFNNCEFNDNDWSQLAGLNGSAMNYSGSIATSPGWSYKGNKHPSPLPAITGSSLVVLGLDAATVSQSGATNVTNVLGLYSGQNLTLQQADANTTYVIGGNILIHSGTPAAAASNSVWKMFSYSSNMYLNQFFTP